MSAQSLKSLGNFTKQQARRHGRAKLLAKQKGKFWPMDVDGAE